MSGEAGCAVGIVLAAGGSTRMGRAKPLLRIGDASYLETVVGTLRAGGLEHIIVVLGHRAEQVRRAADLTGCAVVHNAGWRKGEMLSSLQHGLAAATRLSPAPDAAVVALVDVPRVRPATVSLLVAGRAAKRAPIVVPEFRGRHGHPVLFGWEVWHELMIAPADRGARAVVEAHRAELLALPVEDPWVLRDADTPAEHEHLRRGR